MTDRHDHRDRLARYVALNARSREERERCRARALRHASCALAFRARLFALFRTGRIQYIMYARIGALGASLLLFTAIGFAQPPSASGAPPATPAPLTDSRPLEHAPQN